MGITPVVCSIVLSEDRKPFVRDLVRAVTWHLKLTTRYFLTLLNHCYKKTGIALDQYIEKLHVCSCSKNNKNHHHHYHYHHRHHCHLCPCFCCSHCIVIILILHNVKPSLQLTL